MFSKKINAQNKENLERSRKCMALLVVENTATYFSIVFLDRIYVQITDLTFDLSVQKTTFPDRDCPAKRKS